MAALTTGSSARMLRGSVQPLRRLTAVHQARYSSSSSTATAPSPSPPPSPVGAVASSSAATAPLASSIYTSPSPSSSPSSSSATLTSITPSLSPPHRSTLSSLLRVDHSGEIAANTIYKAQSAIFHHIKRDAQSSALTMEMWENEKKHLKVAEILLKQHAVRPSLLNPVWGALGSLLGGVTALMGREAAMACTEAVETVIGEHYDDQITHLDQVLDSFRNGVEDGQTRAVAAQAASEDGSPSQAVRDSLTSLRSILEEFRDDELEHLDTAVEHDAQQAPAHALLSAVIGWGCKGAIEVAKRI